MTVPYVRTYSTVECYPSMSRQDPRFLMYSVSPGYLSTKPLYILLQLTRKNRNSAEIGGLLQNKISTQSGRQRHEALYFLAKYLVL